MSDRPTDPSPAWQTLRHACTSHARITDALRELENLPRLAAAPERARAAAAALQALDQVLHEHHAQEEQELFLAVLRSCRGERECRRAHELADRLSQEHRCIEEAWERLRPVVVLAAAGQPIATSPLADQVRGLATLHAAHLRFEEDAFLPLADAVLGRAQAAAPGATHLAAV